MSVLKNKIDFAVIIACKDANPNGDPQMAGRPRVNADGEGFISDVCLKRKIRNRLQDFGEEIFVQSSDRAEDDYSCLKERAMAHPELGPALAANDKKTALPVACKEWADVRAFGQLFAFPLKNKKGKAAVADEDGEEVTAIKGGSVSVGIRGPVTIQHAYSTAPIEIVENQITKSCNGVEADGAKSQRSADTMGYQYRVPFAVYVTYGSINARMAQDTGLTEADAKNIHEALKTLFENDESSARPSGSMHVAQVIWWKHDTMDAVAPSGMVHRCLTVDNLVASPKSLDDIMVTCKKLKGIDIETMPDGIQVDIIDDYTGVI